MQHSLTAFMEGLIDYAGLFPPAQLDLDPALRLYAHYRADPDAWMLGRFIVPAGRLADLAPYHAELFAGSGKPFRFAVLAGGGAAHEEAFARLHQDGQAIREFQQRHGTSVRVEVLETRLPDDLARSPGSETVAGYLRSVASVLGREQLAGLELFLEVPVRNLPQAAVTAAVAGIGGFVRQGGTGALSGTLRRAGFKLRCGGPEAAAFPAPEMVAGVLAACREHEVPLKCTAGLHHPVRAVDANLGIKAHGFLNVFGAGLLAHARKLSLPQIIDCLQDEAAASFTFTEQEFAWRDQRVPTAEIARSRRRFMTGFGSCSFDEPREDLRRLGLLAASGPLPGPTA